MTYPCQRRGVSATRPAVARVRQADRLRIAGGYLAGFRDAADGAPFDPEHFDVVDNTATAFGLPRQAWLSLIGRKTNDEL